MEQSFQQKTLGTILVVAAAAAALAIAVTLLPRPINVYQLLYAVLSTVVVALIYLLGVGWWCRHLPPAEAATPSVKPQKASTAAGT